MFDVENTDLNVKRAASALELPIYHGETRVIRFTDGTFSEYTLVRRGLRGHLADVLVPLGFILTRIMEAFTSWYINSYEFVEKERETEEEYE